MSRFLKNVGQFLEKLDDQAEKRVEEQRLQETKEDGDDYDAPDLESILAARGLKQDLSQDDEEGYKEKQQSVETTNESDVRRSPVAEDAAADGTKLGDVKPEYNQEKSENKDGAVMDGREEIKERSETIKEGDLQIGEQEASDQPTEQVEKEEHETVKQDENEGADEHAVTTPAPQPENSVVAAVQVSAASESHGGDGPKSETPVATPLASAPLSAVPVPAEPQPPSNSSYVTSSNDAPSSARLRESQKEARTLRRHVVSLNKQLEAAEAEIEAQRKELERAAERMEKDRARHKEERDKEKLRQSDEVKKLKAQHEQVLKEFKQRTDQQLEEVRKQLKSVEERRMQEGGDMNKELTDAVQREQETIQKLSFLEDEKFTLLSQIATLQAQQEALGSRLESLTETADNAMAREREAEDRLDEALSAHARQISQRQAREAELERTISELGAALVQARDKKNSQGDDGAAALNQDSLSKIRVESLENELETLRAQLAHEQQRSSTLHKELQDFTKEQTEEASVAQARQLQHDRQVGELSQTISSLKNELREARQQTIRESASADRAAGDAEDLKQIRNLSEEVLKQREKVMSCNSEISALKRRLHVALDRAAKAEAAVDEKTENGNEFSDVELGPEPGMRRRGSIPRRSQRSVPSMRKALNLDAMQGEGSQRVGRSLDALDAFLTQSGKFLRYNPLARLLFLVYLLLLHLWTFFLLFFHAHGFETVHGDFGSGGSLPHGPNAVMQQHAAQNQQQAMAANPKEH